MSVYKDYFDSVTPSTSDRAFADSVINSAKKPKRSFKAVISVSAAAAAAMALTFTVSAAYNWDIRAAVRAFFGDKNNIAEENIADVKVLNMENTFEDIDISVKGAAADKNFLVVFLDIDRKDGGIIDCAPYNVKDKDGNDIIMSDGNIESELPVYELKAGNTAVTYTDESGNYNGYEETASRQYTVIDDDYSDGHITQAICIDISEPFFGYAEGPFVCDKVKLGFSGFYGKKCTGSYIGNFISLSSYPVLEMSGSFSCEIDLNWSSTRSCELINPGTAHIKTYSHAADPNDIEFRNFEFSVKSLSVSSVSVSVQLEGTAPEDTFYVEPTDFGSVIMNDGREIRFGNYMLPSIVKESGNIKHISVIEAEDKWSVNAGFILPETVNTDDISAIKIGDSVFKIN